MNPVSSLFIGGVASYGCFSFAGTHNWPPGPRVGDVIATFLPGFADDTGVFSVVRGALEKLVAAMLKRAPFNPWVASNRRCKIGPNFDYVICVEFAIEILKFDRSF